MRDYIQKVLMPRLLVTWFALRWPGIVWARTLRLLGLRAQIELYFAFDDPYSVVALPLLEVVERRRAELRLYPIIERGIAGDPALNQRRRFSLTDSQRLLQRRGLALKRRSVLSPEDTAFLAYWTESLRGQACMQAFTSAALKRLWLETDGPIDQDEYALLFQQVAGHAPPATSEVIRQAVANNHIRQLRKGHWESPAARVQGEWFFAHERVPQIEERLSYLGW